MDHLTVVCLVAWPLHESETGGDLVLIEITLVLLLSFKGQAVKHTTVNGILLVLISYIFNNNNYC